jgi:hypothetical protein
MKIEKVVVRITMVVLLVTAISKFISLATTKGQASSMDPVFWMLSQRQVLAMAALIEFAMVIALFGENLGRSAKIFLIFLTANLFLGYRVASWAYTGGFACGCLGLNATQSEFWPNAAAIVTSAFLAFMLFGSGALLWRSRWDVAGKAV